MKLTLSDILKISSLKDAQLIFDSKKKSINDISVSNIMIMEGHDVEKWVESNEILLSSLIGYSKINEPDFIKLFQKLAELKCSGVVIKLGRYLTSVPQHLKETAISLDLPLIIIANDIQYKDIMFQTTQLLFNESNRQLEIYRKTNQKFVDLMENVTNVKVLIDKLSEILNNPVTIVKSIKYESRNIVSTSKTSVTNEFVRNVPKSKLFSRTYFIHEFELNKTKQIEILTKLHTRNEDNRFICITLDNNNINDDSFISIDVAANFIDLQLNIESNIKNLNKVKINDSIDYILNEEHSQSTDLPNILTEHGFIKEKSIKLIYCEFPSEQSDKNFSVLYDHPNIVSSFVMNSKIFWENLIYRTWPNRLLIMIQTDNDINQIKLKLHKIINYIDTLLPTETNIRISITQTDYRKLKQGSEECLNTLSLSSIIFRDSHAFITTKNDLGIYQLLTNMNDISDVSNLIPEELLLVKQQEPELITTLEQYIINLGNLSKSANALFIHPKTMSYRIKKLEDKYHLDLTNSNELTNLSIGIHLLKLI